MRITLIQTDIAWENKTENLRRLREKLEMLRGTTEIVVLPETFSTGFSMDAERMAEPADGETITILRRWAQEYGVALTGSFMACEPGNPPTYHNRAFFLTPEGEAHFCDKRHLFCMGGEAERLTPGKERCIISYKGWRILPIVCYDLRFPVWSRNRRNDYDLLLYVANWPAGRRMVWDVLLQARALENQCYVCGVNRIGTDQFGYPHDGGSVIYSPKGKLLAHVADDTDGTATASLDLGALQVFRRRFPVWEDSDTFHLTEKGDDA